MNQNFSSGVVRFSKSILVSSFWKVYNQRFLLLPKFRFCLSNQLPYDPYFRKRIRAKRFLFVQFFQCLFEFRRYQILRLCGIFTNFLNVVIWQIRVAIFPRWILRAEYILYTYKDSRSAVHINLTRPAAVQELIEQNAKRFCSYLHFCRNAISESVKNVEL